MKRREFLTLLSAVLTGVSTYANSATTPLPAAQKKRIVVIGAGIAGLAAARTLQNQGHDVQVLEARSRIGGRIWTSTRWQDIPLDLGATWIHGVTGNPITQLAQQIQAKRLTTSYNKAATYNTNGKVFSASQETQLAALRSKIFAAITKAQNQDPDISIQQAIQALLNATPVNSETYRWIHFIVNSELEQEYSGSIAALSAQWYDDDSEFGGDDVLFAQGYSTITQFLAQGLRIELNQAVKEIRWNQTPIQVITQNKKFDADRVVVTLPLGVLQANRVLFTPALPSDKRNAIAKLKMGVLNKCYLRFPTVFWPNNVDWIEYISAQHGEWAEWVSFKRVANQPILLGFNAADQGKAIEAWSDQQIVASAMQTLRTIYGANIPEPLDYQITRWASDPFAFGSYSFNSLGSTPKMRDTLAAPLNKQIFFAGEATHRNYFGTTHGAYLSGVRAAEEVLKT